jgi:hypothetical protein
MPDRRLRIGNSVTGPQPSLSYKPLRQTLQRSTGDHVQQKAKHINHRHRRLLRRWRAGSAAACLIAATVVVAGCGGGSNGPGVAGAGSASTGAAKSSAGGSRQQRVLAYSRCMRAHGLKDFPDPSSGGLTIRVNPGSDLDPNNPQFKSAQQACRSLDPKPTAGEQRQASARDLKYAQCMRAHGIKDFPDPDSQGGIKITGGPGSDLDPNNPQFKSADQSCQHFRGGPPGGGQSQSSGGGAP